MKTELLRQPGIPVFNRFLQRKKWFPYTQADADFRLGLNPAQTTLKAIAELAGPSLKK